MAPARHRRCLSRRAARSCRL
jgi:hypothetical protein